MSRTPASHRVALCAALFCVACGGGESMSDASIDGTAADARMGCQSAEECDDGAYCNGAEQCDPSDPDADARGCVAALAPCTDCDEDTDRCRTVCADADGDGATAMECGGLDCDDGDPQRYAGATEVCDTLDHDEDCDPVTFGFRDADGDGYPDARCCNVDAGGTRACGEDCNDVRPGTNPDVPETCNGVDDDCDSNVDEAVERTFNRDFDGDGFGDATMSMRGCMLPAGFVENGTDCDDTTNRRSPGTVEVCDGVDNDCNTLVDDGVTGAVEVCDGMDNDCDGSIDDGAMAVTWYRDADGDSRGTTATTMTACVPPAGYVQIAGDCDDGNPDVYTGHSEDCDGYDNNCNGLLDYSGEDDDHDGHGDTALCGGVGAADDCDDADAATHPGASELCDRQDQDCNNAAPLTRGGLDPAEDADSDGFAPAGLACSGGPLPRTDCDDTRASVHPGVPEICNGRDDECNGTADDDPAASSACAAIPMGTPACIAGACAVGVCASSRGDCDGTYSNGCETDTSTTEAHCGTCAIACGATEACIAGVCQPNYVAQVSGGTQRTCAVRQTGTLLCWGAAYTTVSSSSLVPVPIPGIADAVQVACGRDYCCVVRATGEVDCWGDNSQRQLGDGSSVARRDAPTPMAGITDGVEVAVSSYYDFSSSAYELVTCVRRAAGEVLCAGNGFSRTPIPVTLPGPASAIAVTGDQSCAIVAGAVHCWRSSSSGSAATGGISSATRIVAHQGRVCVLQAGRMMCWAAPGQTASMQGTATDLTGIGIGGGDTAMTYYGIRASGVVECWGYNFSGGCGIGTTSVTVSTPTPVMGLSSGVLAIVGGHGAQACAVRATELRCWGSNGQGQVGDGTMTNRNVPVVITLPP